MKLRSTAAAVAIAATATMGLAACGGEEAPKAKDAWNASQESAGKYKSMEVKASGKSNGKPASFTIKGDVDGDPQTLSGEMEGGKMEAVIVGSKSYIKADSAYWKSAMGNSGASSAMTSMMADKWVESPESNSEDASDTLKDLVKELKDDNNASNKKLLSDKATVTEEKVDGKDAWKIESEDKKVKAWVSKEDSRDVLKVEGWEAKTSSSSNDEMTTVNFLSHDKDYGIKAPSGAKKMTDLIKG